jgi:putative peptide zinc metalloprotease protein
LGVLPILYLKIGGLYTLSAARRIRVWSAGIFWNITFASLILMARYSFPLAEPYGATLMKVVLANFSIAIVNLFPFLPTDGYFILSTILKRFNVRTHAWREFGNWICFRRHQFSGFLVIYFIFTVGILALILHRDFAWIREMRNIRSPGDGFRLFLVLLAPALLMVNLLRRLVRSK